MVLDSFSFLKKAYKPKSTGYYFDPDGLRIREGTYQTIYRAFKTQVSQREAYLLKAFREGSLADEDYLDWERLEKKKFWWPKGVLQKPRSQWSSDEVSKYLGELEPVL